MERRSVSLVAGMLGAAASFMGFGGSMTSAAASMQAAGPALAALRSHPSHAYRMERRSTLHHKKRNYSYDPFTPAPMALQYGGEPTRQVARQHQRRLGKAVESRLKREARRA